MITGLQMNTPKERTDSFLCIVLFCICDALNKRMIVCGAFDASCGCARICNLKMVARNWFAVA